MITPAATDRILKWSLFYLHVMIGVLTLAVLLGRESSIIVDLVQAFLWAVGFNLATLSGNKALQKSIDGWITAKNGGQNADNSVK